MFLKFYGLREQPFGTTPDPRLLYLGASHREALASLIYGIESGRGFMAMIAQPGMGKTTLLFQLMQRLQDSARTVFLFQTEGSVREFFSSVIADLGLDPTGQDLPQLYRQLNAVLLEESRSGKQLVLVIDEAQNLDASVLESVRMLSNFETPSRKLLQIVLAGQPPLADKLAMSNLEQLKQRVSIICRLEPFKEKEVADYISHRLEMAGRKGGPLFTPEALSLLATRSQGIPRNINNLCFHALSLGYAKRKKKIDAAIMTEVTRDLDIDTLRNSNATPPRAQGRGRQQYPNRDFGEVSFGRTPSATSNSDRPISAADVHLPSRNKVFSQRRRAAGGSIRWLAWAFTVLAGLFVAEAFLIPGTTVAPLASISGPLSGVAARARKFAVEHGLIAQNATVGKRKASPSTQSEASDLNLNAATTAGSTASTASQAAQTDNLEQDGPTAGSNNPTMQSAEQSSFPAIGSIEAGAAAKTFEGTPPQDASTSHETSRAHDGKIIVDANYSGSSITINGQTKSMWRTPHVFSLAPGTYRIAVSRAGYSTWFKRVRVDRGARRRLMAHLSSPRGVILIDTKPHGMQVYIDGRRYGRSEVEAELRPGSHTYKIVPPSGVPLVGKFFLRPGAIMSRMVTVPDGRPSAESIPGAASHARTSRTRKERRTS